MISAPFSSTAKPNPSRCRRARARVLLAAGVLPVLAATLAPSPAAADFRLCNRSSSRVGIALGYKDGNSWATEGWWNIGANSCETLLRGDLVARYYYVYAIDYDLGGEWSGKAYMCTREKEFTIRGIADCLARGYDRTGFFEVDTQEQKSWTVQLTEPQRSAAPAPGDGRATPPAPPKKP
ncbi:DUF1036 domain-containing protein [Ancylobacter sp. SL191]|uniref:DUF1036 domain-containing protein n=1 Tax=Ancylobacter sp. SL191 TaxID=2995166 RepID=UPI00226EBA15|nr:DUF1036 domain-containing protein [Ancylobacter sp. SL191]WAC28872.1 DUF1036 domain-containing protein [Ancylobacter sp. SL191]